MKQILRAFLLVFLTIHHTECLISNLGLFLSEQVTVTNIDHQILMNRVAQLLNTTYLFPSNDKIKTSYSAIVWGRNARLLTAMPVRLSSQQCPIQINVIFQIDTGAPITTLTKETLQILFKNCPNVKVKYLDLFQIQIAGQIVQVSESQAHYSTLNILGTNLMRLLKARLQVNYSNQIPEKASIQFNANKLKEKEEL